MSSRFVDRVYEVLGIAQDGIRLRRVARETNIPQRSQRLLLFLGHRMRGERRISAFETREPRSHRGRELRSIDVLIVVLARILLEVVQFRARRNDQLESLPTQRPEATPRAGLHSDREWSA